MIQNTDYSFVIASRLKELRGRKGLSFDRLSKELKEKYGISISSDSLMNYEVIEPNHSKSKKNLGMRIEYLRCLADFYGVSSDYLLGISDIQSPNLNIQDIVNHTGFNERIVQIAIGLNKYTNGCDQIDSCADPFVEDFFEEIQDKKEPSAYSRKAIEILNLIISSSINCVYYNLFFMDQFLVSAQNWHSGKGKFVIPDPAVEKDGRILLTSPEAATFFLSRAMNMLEDSIWDTAEKMFRA